MMASNDNEQGIDFLRAQVVNLIWRAYNELQEAKFDGTISERGWQASSHLCEAEDCDNEEWPVFVESARAARETLLANSSQNSITEKTVLEMCQTVGCIERIEFLEQGLQAASDRQQPERTSEPHEPPVLEEGRRGPRQCKSSTPELVKHPQSRAHRHEIGC